MASHLALPLGVPVSPLQEDPSKVICLLDFGGSECTSPVCLRGHDAQLLESFLRGFWELRGLSPAKEAG